MAKLVMCHQQVPHDFAEMLQRMRDASKRDAEASRRLTATLALAHDNGWTFKALGDALGVSWQAIEQRCLRARPTADLPDVPMPPSVPEPTPRPARQLTLKPDAIAELCEMYAIAKTVNGTCPTHDPKRRVGERLAAQLAAYVEQGVTVTYLAQVMGVNYNTINFRLGRHGFTALPPSQERTRYQNKQARKRRAAA